MSEREKIKTTKEQIVDYWIGHEDECGLSVLKHTKDVGAVGVKEGWRDAISYRIPWEAGIRLLILSCYTAAVILITPM